MRANPNPFAVCVLTSLLAMKRKGADDNELKAMKHDLYDEMMSKEKRHAIYTFLTYFVRFEKKEMFHISEREIKEKLGKEDAMGITEYLLDKAKKEGIKKERAKAEKLLAQERAKAEAEKLAEKLQSALEFKKMGIPVADISKGLDLTLEQVKKLK